MEVAPSPNIDTDNAVITAVKATLTKLFPKRIVAKSLSTLEIMFDISSAPGTLEFTKYDSLLRWKERKAASELEKKADKKRNNPIRIKLPTISAVNYYLPYMGIDTSHFTHVKVF